MKIIQEAEPPAYSGEKTAHYWDTHDRKVIEIGNCVVGADWKVEFIEEGPVSTHD